VEDKGEICLLLSDALDLTDALKGLGLVDAAAETIKRVGREDDGAAVGQTFKNHLDIARVGVGWVKFEYHRLTEKSRKNSELLNWLV